MSTFDPSNHEHDEHGDCLDSEGDPVVLAEVAAQARPQWAWSWWEVATVLASLASGIGREVHQAMAYLSRECVAAANVSRTRKIALEQEAHRAARRQMIAEDIRRLQEGETDG